MSHFKLISSTKACDVIPVDKYVSEKTGLTVIIAGVEGLLVHASFCLATVSEDDIGLPSALEQLIFKGSERYPHNGFLDQLAKQRIPHDNYVWSDKDHTCYNVYTIGDGSMLTLLPIYLDHIFNPALTEEAFITEIHHVDGEGKDGGAMYRSVQAHENRDYIRCDLQLSRALYAGSEYAADSKCSTANLRTSIDITKIRKFHKKYYRPENLTIFLAGLFEAQDVFKALAVVEDDIIAKRQNELHEVWVRPWQNIPGAPMYGEYNVQWPADTEDCRLVQFGWRGPLLTEPGSLKDLTGCAILLRYLCDTAAAPLQKSLMNKENKLAGDISYSFSTIYDIPDNLSPPLKIEFDDVAVGNLPTVRNEALNCIRQHREGTQQIDMQRLKQVIHKYRRGTVTAVEINPNVAIAFRCVADALYSRDNDDVSTKEFISRMNPQLNLQSLLEESPQYWLALLSRYFSDDVVIVMGSPSIQLQAKLAEEEKVRLEEQKESLCKEGLAKKAQLLKEAIDINERPPPPGTLSAVPVPPCDSLKCHNITTWSSDGNSCPHFDLKDLPLYARVHSFRTKVVYINLILDTSSVDQVTRKWIPLHLNGLAECGVHRGDTLVPHGHVIAENKQITVSFYNNIGLQKHGNFSVGHFCNLVQIGVVCEPEDYERVVNHLYEILFAPEITKERLLVFAQRLLDGIPQQRSGSIQELLRDSVYSKDSNVHWCTVLRQQKFLKELIEQLNAGGDSAEAVLAEAKRTFNSITQNVWLHLASDFERYKLSTKPWKRFSEEKKVTPKSLPLSWDVDLTSGLSGGFVVGVEGCESSSMAVMAPGPLGHDVTEIAPLMVAMEYLTQREGPMRRLIPGLDKTSDYLIRLVHPSPKEGLLMFTLDKTVDAVQAYTIAKGIVEEYVSKGQSDAALLAAAKNTTLLEVVMNEPSLAEQTLVNYLQRQCDTYYRDLVIAVSNVTEDSAHAAAVKWLPSLFDTNVSKLAITCHPAKVTDMHTAFDKINIKLAMFESMEASPFNK